MANLKFDSNFSLVFFGTVSDGSDCPLNNDDLVELTLNFGPIIDTSPEQYLRAQTTSTDIILEASLTPEVDLDTGDLAIQSQIRLKVNSAKIYTLRFMADTEDILRAVITKDDNLIEFPFLDGQKVKMTLIVEDVQRLQPLSPDDDSERIWQGLLSPFGKEVNGLILSEVELVE